MPTNDPKQIAADLIRNKRNPNKRYFQTEDRDEAQRVKDAIPLVDENYIGCMEDISVRKKVNGFREHVDKKTGERRLVKTRWCWMSMRAWSVWAHLHPDIEMDAIVNALKGFGREAGADKIVIGETEIDPKDDYDV
ncbi:MAG: hypothetical protein ACXADB_06105 [Candidatus Hermodarchaeia archaeon]|jgi:hypothetical protein